MSSKPARDGAARPGVWVRELTIQNRYGIHARPAALCVKTLSAFRADITIQKGDMKVSGKSIMGLMTLEAGQGTVLRVIAEGPDGDKALDELEKLVAHKFYED